MTTSQAISPGEANLRKRRRRKILTYTFCGLFGAVLGLLLAFGEQGEGNFLSRDFAGLSLDPTFALLMAGAAVLGFIVLPIWGFTQVDELLRQQNLIGMAGGCIAVISGYPVWVMLYAGGFVEFPHATGVYLLAFGGMIASSLYAYFRS